MKDETDKIIKQATQLLNLPEGALFIEGMNALLERRISALNADILAITERYQVSSVEEMEARYEEGSLSEIGSWEDFQRLDHLEYDREQVRQLLKTVRSLREADSMVAA
jgi:hypothetical protein